MAIAPRNFLALVPIRMQSDFNREGDRVVIRAPRFRSSMGKAFGRLLRRSEYLTLKLDPRTSFCWDLIDGKRNVQQICDLVKERFSDQVEPIVPRMMELIGMLERNRLIKVR